MCLCLVMKPIVFFSYICKNAYIETQTSKIDLFEVTN